MNNADPKEILEFIQRFKSPDEKGFEYGFQNGDCYWFAFILKGRFGGQIKYLPISCHFICKIGKEYYDITGCLSSLREPVLDWNSYKKEDESHWNRIYKDCILLK